MHSLTEKAAFTYSASWMLWPSSLDHALSLPRSIDHELKGYVWYPESEWSKFGYRPPENYSLLGSWRDPNGQVFAFLLDASLVDTTLAEKRFLFYVSGARNGVDNVGAKVTALKSLLAKYEREELQLLRAKDRVDQERGSPAIARLLKVIGLFTIVVNAFSFSLRQLPIPYLPNPWMQGAYQAVVAKVHFAALVLLLVAIAIIIVYVFRYGILVLRRF